MFAANRLLCFVTLLAFLPTMADAKALKCRNWIDGQFKGSVKLAVERDGISVSPEPGLAYFNDYKFSVLLEKNNKVVLAGMYQGKQPSPLHPMMIVSLDFGKARLHLYSDVGSVTEGDTVISKVSWECERLD